MEGTRQTQINNEIHIYFVLREPELSEQEQSELKKVISQIEKKTACSIRFEFSEGINPYSASEEQLKMILSVSAPDIIVTPFFFRNVRPELLHDYFEPIIPLIKLYAPNMMRLPFVEQSLPIENEEFHVYEMSTGPSYLDNIPYWIIRQDVREQLDCPRVTTFDDLILLLSKAKVELNFEYPGLYHDSKWQGIYSTYFEYKDRYNINGASRDLIFRDRNGTQVKTLFDEGISGILLDIEKSKSLFEMKLLGANLSDNYYEQQTEGNWAATYVTKNISGGGADVYAIQSANPTVAFEVFTAHSAEILERFLSGPGKILVPKTDPESIKETMRFLDACASEEVSELLRFGIEGIHWSRIGQFEFLPIQNTYYPKNTTINPFALLALYPNPRLINSSLPESLKEELKRILTPTTITENQYDPLKGFKFDPNPVEDLVARRRKEYSPMLDQLLYRENTNIETKWSDFKKIAQKDIYAIRDELQEQINGFLQAKE